MAPTEEAKRAAQAVKLEANGLFQAGKFKEAYIKYSEAIELDDTNAILFANRAACCLGLEEYLQAACDARKATKLDAGYVKAWARLGKAYHALKAYKSSVDAWKRASQCIPNDVSKLTDVDKQIKSSCDEGLMHAMRGLRSQTSNTSESKMHLRGFDRSILEQKLFPWQVAERLEPDEKKIGTSSAWVVLAAHREFMAGCKLMQEIRVGAETTEIPIGAIALMTNGILRDSRAFLIESTEWFDLYNRQILLEVEYFGGWPSATVPEVQRLALKLQQEKGFEASRGALSVTVRGLFMRAFMSSSGKQGDDISLSLELYRRALSILEWGRETWKNVPDSVRGAIFSRTFVRGIRRFYLEAYFKKWKFAASSFIPQAVADGQELDKMAQDQIRETNENPYNGIEESRGDKTFCLAFYSYPVAEAFRWRGEVAMNTGLRNSLFSPELARQWFEQAKKHLMATIKLSPEDEESILMDMKTILEAMWHLNEPLGECIAWVGKIAAAQPAVDRIWTHSAMRNGIEHHLAQAYKYRELACAGIIEGQFTTNSPAKVVDLSRC